MPPPPKKASLSGDNDSSPGGNYTLGCGAFAQDKWSSFGCNVTYISAPANSSDFSGFVTCSCNHASDYTTWTAFEQDVSSLGHFDALDLTSLATIGIIVVAVMIPLIVVLWMLLVFWARRRDKNDADMVHRGTFVIITMNKIRLHDRQRRFFRALRRDPGPHLPKPLPK